jgi:hypothetical protein
LSPDPNPKPRQVVVEKKVSRLKEEQIQAMPAMAKLSQYLAADDIDSSEVEETPYPYP